MPFCTGIPVICQRKNSVTLQVQCPTDITGGLVKRVLAPASGTDRGSLSVEAALCLSLFIFAVVCLMLPIRMLDTQRKIQTVLEAVGEDVSRLAYVEWKKEQGAGELNRQGGWEQDYEKMFVSGAISVYLRYYVTQAVGSNQIDRLSFSKTRVMEDGEHIELVMDYRMLLPFSVFRVEGLSMTARSYRRAWIGKDGGKGQSKEGGRAEDPTVYVGKSMGRYHWLRDCHYLYNNLSAVSLGQIDRYRNQGGGKYKPCSVCGKGAQAGSTVYIMPSADRYHSNALCSSIISYVRAVSLSEVEYLGACSYCNRKK